MTDWDRHLYQVFTLRPGPEPDILRVRLISSRDMEPGELEDYLDVLESLEEDDQDAASEV